MTTCLGKSCSISLPRVPFSFGFEGRIWDLTVSVPDHCLSFYFPFPTVTEQFNHWGEYAFQLFKPRLR